MKRSILFLMMAIFFIACEQPGRVTSEFAIIEDNTTNGVEKPVDEPDSGSTGGDSGQPQLNPLTEKELDLRNKLFPLNIRDSSVAVFLDFYGDRVDVLKSKEVKITAKITVTERTENVDAKQVIENIQYDDYFVDATYQTRKISVLAGMSKALPAAGSYAKVEIELYIQDKRTANNQNRFGVTTRKVVLLLRK